MADNMSTMPLGIPDLKKTEAQDAKKEGAKEYIKESVKAQMATDTGTAGDVEDAAEKARFRVAVDLNSTFIAPLLDLNPDDLANRLKDKPKGGAEPVDFETAKGLLHLERAGKNRTIYVETLLAAIGADKVTDVTNAGPPYTNDVAAVSVL